MAATSGSTVGVVVVVFSAPAPAAAQTGALGQPAQVEPLPASAALVPGQPVFVVVVVEVNKREVLVFVDDISISND